MIFPKFSILCILAILLCMSMWSYSQETCPELPDSSNHPCISILNWDHFKASVISNESHAQSDLVFCPFTIVKLDDGPLVITNQLVLLCLKPGQCVIKSNKGSGMIQMKGLAKVSMYGFVFQAAGTVFNTVSAIHVAFGTSFKQIFCNCEFRGFQGHMRGTAIRSEPRTDIDIVDCKFEGNTSHDIGTIFNRGTMGLYGCTFYRNNGRGGSLGSSRRSLTILKDNVFVENSDGMTLFFHDNVFDDDGGNIALNNDHCNGIFVTNGQKCIAFKNESVSTRTNPDIIQEINDCSPNLVQVVSSCVSIDSFSDLKSKVKFATGTLVFCPFTVEPAPSEFLDITTKVTLSCSYSGGCRISGSTRHIRIIGPSSQVSIQGFVFERATIHAVIIISSAVRKQTFCDCQFITNQGKRRGVGLLAERFTNVQVILSRFENNQSLDIGGSIFNRGSMVISKSMFVSNNGRGSAIGNAPRATISLINNQFHNNSDGEAIFFHDATYNDLGGNIAENNGKCNGIFVERQNGKCIKLNYDLPSLPAPTQPAIPTNAPRGGLGYFNYDKEDDEYGPNGWGDVKYSTDFIRYKELQGTLRRSLINKCNWKNVKQSPIDLCESYINNDCKEHHQTRTHSGNIKLGASQVTAQILPSKLRLKYYPDRPPLDGPYPPEADFAYKWNGFAEVNHIDIKIPSEHTICGTQYPAEYSIYMVHPTRRQTIVLSILLSLSEDDKSNDHLQKAIDEWQKVYDENNRKCNTSRNLLYSLRNETKLHFSSSNYYESKFDPISMEKYTYYDKVRNLTDTTPFGRGGWDPFHSSLMTSIYHWGYWGTLTEPPCSNFIAWRIQDKPAYISKAQLNQMKMLLFTNQNSECEYTSVSYNHSVARPIQRKRGRLLHKCTRDDYVSDKEKAEMKEATGDPNWCC